MSTKKTSRSSGKEKVTVFRRAFPSPLSSFIDYLNEVTEEFTDPEILVSRIRERMAGILRDPNLVPEQFLRHPLEGFGRNMLIRGRNYIMVCLVWPPGVGSPVHDHGTWGVAGIFRNRMTITEYARLDDGTKPEFARLRETKSIEAEAGGVGIVLPPDREIHKMENRTRELSASLHVYGQEIREAHRFDLKTNKVETFFVPVTNE